MNLRGRANGLTKTVNPNTPITVKISNGYTKDPATLRQVPTYLSYNAMGNIQALDGDEMEQINYLNIEGTIRGAYLYGSVSGVIRPNKASTAQLIFSSNENGVTKERQWDVFKVLETWQGWCKVAIVLKSEDLT